MKENNNISEEMIRNEDDEKSGLIEEMIEEIENEVSDIVEDTIGNPQNESEEIKMKEEAVEQSQEEVTGDLQETAEDEPLPEKIKKNAKALHLVNKAKKIVEKTRERTKACKLLLESDLQKYADAKAGLNTGGLDACVSLLNKLGSTLKDVQGEEKPNSFDIQTKAELNPITLQNISSGRFTGFILALLGGAATAIGLVYLATEKLEMTLNVTKVPSEDVVQSLLAWFSTIIGLHEDVYIGVGVFGAIVLLVMIFIYAIRVGLKANSNLHFAAKQFVEAQLYEEQNANCEEKVKVVDAHIKDAIETLKTYQVLLNEQQGKLQRIFHIEGEKEKSTEYHDKSYTEIADTKELIVTINDFMDTPMSEEGKLSSKSILLLQNTKDQIDKFLKRFY